MMTDVESVYPTFHSRGEYNLAFSAHYSEMA